MRLDDATRAQVAAADPRGSSWLMANAGSGKTRVLTNRVAWLLLNGAPPERILCLTFTKAAAAEMQNRLFGQLGGWAMLDDGALSDELAAMGIAADARRPEALAGARTLFARAIEAPGGLKIQTIHAFAAAILRRFPLEAGVSPTFTEIDGRAQAQVMDAALHGLASGPEAEVVARVAGYLSGSDMRDLTKAVLGARLALGRPDTDPADWLGLPPGLTETGILAGVFLGEEAALCARLAGHLDAGNKQQAPMLDRLSAFPWHAPTLPALADLEAVFLTGAQAKAPHTAKVGSFANAAVRTALGADLPQLEAFMMRIETARDLRLGLAAAEQAGAFARFGRAFLPRYDAEMAARGAVDFDDLIRRARALLTDPALAPWVLYRLDGGVDHLLVDEAQDTSPAQWAIVRAVAEEFAAGHGARTGVARTLFVVGDEKQSIYSFQGADPGVFAEMRRFFSERLADAPAPFAGHELVHSFRSAPEVLALVDEVGTGPFGTGSQVRHSAFHQGLPGRVDIWPAVEPEASAVDEPAWYDPVDRVAATHPTVRLAIQIADWIAQTLDAPPLIGPPGAERPLGAGDILILVRRRSGLFSRLIDAIKSRGLPILGADRFTVTDHLAVKDLLALLKVLATPDDDLSLAAALRSPLFGISEDDLFRLAHGRSGPLRHALSDGPAREMLDDLWGVVDRIGPFELLDRALTRHGMRTRILARLGPEAEDGIDALLTQALIYDRAEAPSLLGFIDWLEAEPLEVKRDPGGQPGQIRVMTVHGAKGLEAPVVILPETGMQSARTDPVRTAIPEDGPPFWLADRQSVPSRLLPHLDAAEAAREAEDRRLLYVAMTRAAQWLVVAAAGKITKVKNQKPLPAESHSWYGAIEVAARRLGATSTQMPGGLGLRLESGAWQTAAQGPVPGAGALAQALPDWAQRPPERRQAPVARTPSDLGGAKALPGDAGAEDSVRAAQRGRHVHLLLEHLPTLPPAAWASAAPSILGREGPHALTADEIEALLTHASAVLTAPDLAHLFRPGSLAEVQIAADSPTLGAPLVGQIDRLIVEETTVTAVDFKSNALVPDTAAAVPEGLLRQMGAYAEMLVAVYPGRRIETAILWTSTARLMPLPHDLVTAALTRAGRP